MKITSFFKMEKFHVDRVLGKGGFGKALLVSSLTDGRKRVVKQILKKTLTKKEQEKAMSEITILSNLKHTNIIKYRGCKITDNSIFILMDYAEGGDLSTKIKERNLTKFSEEQIIDWFTQICLAVKYLHDRKIIHRDIKPGNIFLDSKGIVKLGDFGLAKYLPNTQAFAKTATGSPYYLPPEICKGEQYNFSADIWSLGCVLYELCSLKRAFTGTNIKDIMASIIHIHSPRIPMIYSKELSNIASSMLQKDPTKRPTINQLLQIPLLKYKAIALLGPTQAEIELSHTVFHGSIPGETPAGANKEVIMLFNDKKNEIKENDKKEEKEQGTKETKETEDEEKIKFMGRTLVLKTKEQNASEKAKALKDFIVELVGQSKMEELYNKILNSQPKDVRLIGTTKDEQYIVQLIMQLIAYETK